MQAGTLTIACALLKAPVSLYAITIALLMQGPYVTTSTHKVTQGAVLMSVSMLMGTIAATSYIYT